jgi:hypothetical protein
MMVGLLMAQAATFSGGGDAITTDRADEDLGPDGLPGFLENAGQVGPEVLFYSWSPDGGVALTDSGAIVTVVDPDTGKGCNVGLEFLGSQGNGPVGTDPLPGVTNILRGNDPDAWRTDLRTYRQVIFPDAWSGIDVVYRLDEGRLKYDMVLGPYADPDAIAIGVSGHSWMGVDDGGDLVVSTVAGTVRDSGLVAFYADDPTTEVDCGFTILDDDSYGFSLGDYDPSRTLVIDPLVYSTYLGGTVGEVEEPSGGVAVDGSERAVVAGQANTTDFPTTAGAFQSANAGGEMDLLVFSMSPDGSQLQWSTYLGGGGADFAYDVALDGLGRAVVVGRTNSTDFPTTSTSYSHHGLGG